MSRRRGKRLSAWASFVPGLGLAGWGWTQLGEPYHLAGLGILEAAALVTWPLAALFIVFGLPAMVMSVVFPRPLRKRWRHRTGFWWAWLGLPPGRGNAKSSRFSKWFAYLVFCADGWRCSACRCPVGLQPRDRAVDHYMPWSLGGPTTLANCFTLCWACNTIKSNAWMFHGRFWPGASAHPELAEEILLCERWHRYNVLRWLRLAWVLAA